MTLVGRKWSSASDAPNWPRTLVPQHRASLPALTAHVCSASENACTAVLMPGIATETLWLLFVPSPIWPDELSPQQRIEPSTSSAQVVCDDVAVMAPTFDKPNT